LIRLCINEKIFNNISINKFLSNEVKYFENRVENILSKPDIKAKFNLQKFENSLIWDEDISKMDDHHPIKISSHSNIAYTIPFTFNLFPPSLNINKQKFIFSGLKNHNLTYKIIFPKGIKIDVINQTNRVILNKSANNEFILEISFNANESDLTESITLKFQPSFIFIINLFIPCIISLLIAFILLIILYFLRKRKKLNKAFFSKDKEINNESYEDKEYYIPPPPSTN
jgi:hypothetical protein